jgi:hypothetical protein
MRIFTQPNGKLTEADRIQLATLLIKAGYTVKITKAVMGGKGIRVVETEETT